MPTSCNCVRLDVLLLLFFFITFKILYCIYLRTKFSHPPVCTFMFIPSTSPTFYHLRLLYIHMSRPTFQPLLCTTFVEITIPHVIYLFIFLYYYIFPSAFPLTLRTAARYTGIPKTIISRIIYLLNLLVINSTHTKIFILVRRILYNNNNYYICPDILTSVFFSIFILFCRPSLSITP
ncbi:unnamed protein product [Aphis gossypii]|uniref:Uncharacterized protein n=1 Tax=Aphis gossypii TaxID=80765 RepID=A0A9P0J592_APHGO|nr:unnamed protein product [Aphis gossypii]